MKRILLVSPFPPYIGGVSVSVQRLYDHLSKEGYEVERFNTQIGNKKYNFKALKFIRYLALPLYLATRKRYDVIHFHVSNIIPKLYVSLWRSFFPKKTRFIITIHGSVRNAFKSRTGYYSLKGFDRIIYVKKGDRKKMPAELISRTVEIPAFIPPLFENGTGKKLPVDLESFLSRPGFKMLLSGFITINEKYHDLYGFRDAVELLLKLKGKGKNADLILIVLNSEPGRETISFMEDIRNYIKKNNLENNIYWIEGVNMELWPLLKRVHVLLRPTKTDGDAMSIRESLYMKVPVITSNVVPRPSGSIVYKVRSPEDFLMKAIALIDNYENYISCLGNHNVNFANKIVEQYDN